MNSARPIKDTASAPGTGAEVVTPTRFLGTDNPRHLRVIHALMARPRRREDVDNIAGCSNGPDLVSSLRCLGLEAPCERIRFIDRDGKVCRPGIYRLTGGDRRKIWAWWARKATPIESSVLLND